MNESFHRSQINPASMLGNRHGAGKSYDADVTAVCLRLFIEKGYSVPDVSH